MNRLAKETSPYLKQHAENPVDWYPWGDEALALARKEDKPILLSVGYSACHWCHVMAHESFEHEQIAAIMNEHYVNIKVDREERPDLDQIYQNVAQLMNQGGGWPLTVFLTPDLRPFYGGTYFPPEDRYGRPGFPRVLLALQKVWKESRHEILENAQNMVLSIEKLESVGTEENVRPDAALIEKTAEEISSYVDLHNGGFGGAPKFPNTMALSFLWRTGRFDAVKLSCTRMAEGGIYDHLGGGFSRYSVDGEWAVPHFEKMLYDNGLLLKLYAETLLSDKLNAAERALYTQTARGIIEWALREMRSLDGAFYAAQDADSLDEHGVSEEGAFFRWTPGTVRAAMESREAKAFSLKYGVTDLGNFENGYTVLSAALPDEDVATTMGAGIDDVRALLATAKAKAFAERAKRARPGLDDKVLCSWNALMISGLAWASRVDLGGLEKDAWDTSEKAFSFIETKMRAGEGRLFSVYAGGQAKLAGYLDDHAFAAAAALDLARFTKDDKRRSELTNLAFGWTQTCLDHFIDSERGGFFFTADDHEALIQRPKTVYDQAIPAGASVAIGNLLALSALTDDAPTAVAYATAADESLYRLCEILTKSPMGMAELANAAMLQVLGPVTLEGEPKGLESWRVFTKKSGTRFVFCHKGTCLPPLNDLESARSELQKLK